MNLSKPLGGGLATNMCKATRPSGGMDSSNPRRLRGWRLHHHGGGVCCVLAPYHNMVVSYSYCWWQNQQCDKGTPLHRDPFHRPHWCASVMLHMPPNEACPWLHWKPLDHIVPAATRATANKATIKKCTTYPGHFDGHGDAPVQYHAHRPIEENLGFNRSHWSPPPGEYCGQ